MARFFKIINKTNNLLLFLTIVYRELKYQLWSLYTKSSIWQILFVTSYMFMKFSMTCCLTVNRLISFLNSRIYGIYVFIGLTFHVIPIVQRGQITWSCWPINITTNFEIFLQYLHELNQFFCGYERND